MSIHKDLILKIVSTAVTLCLLVIMLFFLSNYLSKDDAILIKDLLSIASTIFGALIAVYILQEWIVQKRIESLSNYSKDKFEMFLEISKEHIRYSTSLKKFLLIRQQYEEMQDNSDIKKHLVRTDIDSLINSITYDNFTPYIYNFDLFFNELKNIMLEEDQYLYDEVINNMNAYNELISENGILYLNTEIEIKELQRTINELSNKTNENLYNLRQRLIDYKNYNFNKKLILK